MTDEMFDEVAPGKFRLKPEFREAADQMGHLSPLDKAEGIRQIMVKVGPESQEDLAKIIVDFSAMAPEEMLRLYKVYLATYDTIPADPEGNFVRLYRGEWSIWSGHPGTGKTTQLRQIVCHLLKAGKGVFMYAGEDDPARYLIKIAGTAFGVDLPTEEQLSQFMWEYGHKLFIWGDVSIADPKQILATISKLAKDGKIHHAFVDNLAATDMQSDDYTAQGEFANQVRIVSITRGVHIHLIAHPRKPQKADEMPRQEDVAGASHLVRLCANIFFIRRGPEVGGRTRVYGAEAICLKQREKGWIGTLSYYYHADYRQYNTDPNATGPVHYMPDRFYAPEGIDDEEPFAAAGYIERGPSKAGWDE